MRLYADPVVLYDMGYNGELDLLKEFDHALVLPDAVVAELTTEPVARNVEELAADPDVVSGPCETDWTDRAVEIMDASEPTAEVRIVEGVLRANDAGEEVAVVAEDRRLRTVSEGLGATVTSAFGVVVAAAVDDKYLSTAQAKRIVRRMDGVGVHMTGRLRERAVGLDG